MASQKTLVFFLLLIVCFSVAEAHRGKGKGKGKGRGKGKDNSSSENDSSNTDENVDCPLQPKDERCKNETGDAAEFECPEGYIIKVLKARYSCKVQRRQRCKFAGALDTVKQLCDGQMNCTFPCNSDVFNETGCDCRDGSRILIAKYQCLPDQCSTFCCANNGTCVVTDDGTPMCLCAGSWNGTHCDDNPCENIICENSGTCLVNLNDGTAQCACSDDYTGPTCTTPRFCTPNPCGNGGSCQSTDGRFDSCTCVGNYCGALCECTKNPDDSCPC